MNFTEILVRIAVFVKLLDEGEGHMHEGGMYFMGFWMPWMMVIGIILGILIIVLIIYLITKLGAREDKVIVVK